MIFSPQLQTVLVCARCRSQEPGVPGAGARSVWLRFVIVSCYYLVSQLGLHSPHPGPGNRSGKHQERKNLQIYFFKRNHKNYKSRASRVFHICCSDGIAYQFRLDLQTDSAVIIILNLNFETVTNYIHLNQIKRRHQNNDM